MALDSAFVGRSYPAAATYVVGREKVREFADAVGATEAVHRDPAAARAAGHADVLAPPTFAAIVVLRAWGAVIDDPDLGLNFDRVVHRDQSLTLHKPVCAGDELSATLHVDDIRSLAGNDVLTLRCEIADAGRDAVCTARSTLVARGQPG